MSDTRTKLALVGFWEGNRSRAPFQDPSFVIWGLNHLHPYIPRWDRWLDIHLPSWSARILKPEVWADQDQWLRKDHGKPVFMPAVYPEYPSSVAYPLDDVIRVTGRKYFTNGFAYMLAHALYERLAGLRAWERIEIWGADMRHNEEYAIQRPCAEYWIARCEGAGIEVILPEDCGLCSANALYGYEDAGNLYGEAMRAHAEMQEKTTQLRNDALAKAQTMDGVAQANAHWAKRWKDGLAQEVSPELAARLVKEHEEIRAKAIADRDQSSAAAYTFDGVAQDNTEWIRRWQQRARGGKL